MVWQRLTGMGLLAGLAPNTADEALLGATAGVEGDDDDIEDLDDDWGLGEEDGGDDDDDDDLV